MASAPRMRRGFPRAAGTVLKVGRTVTWIGRDASAQECGGPRAGACLGPARPLLDSERGRRRRATCLAAAQSEPGRSTRPSGRRRHSNTAQRRLIQKGRQIPRLSDQIVSSTDVGWFLRRAWVRWSSGTSLCLRLQLSGRNLLAEFGSESASGPSVREWAAALSSCAAHLPCLRCCRIRQWTLGADSRRQCRGRGRCKYASSARSNSRRAVGA